MGDGIRLGLVVGKPRGFRQQRRILRDVHAALGLVEGGPDRAVNVMRGPCSATRAHHLRVELFQVLGRELVEPVFADTTSDAWETDIESQGHDPAADQQQPEKALTLERIAPPPAIAQRLKMNPETDICVVRRHVRYIDGRAAIISDDFFDQEIVRGTELDIPEDTTRENILAEAGYEQVYDIDEIITRMPTPDEIERLEITPGTPVAEHIRTGYTAANRAVRVMISIIPGDALILQYTIPT